MVIENYTFQPGLLLATIYGMLADEVRDRGVKKNPENRMIFRILTLSCFVTPEGLEPSTH